MFPRRKKEPFASLQWRKNVCKYSGWCLWGLWSLWQVCEWCPRHGPVYLGKGCLGLLDTVRWELMFLLSSSFLPATSKGYGVHSTLDIGLCLVLFAVTLAWPASGLVSMPLVRDDTVALCFWVLCDRGQRGSRQLWDNSKTLPWGLFRISEVSGVV